MEEEKAAAYYEELTRKGEGAARFKQGLGFSSSAPSVSFPPKPSSSASSLFSNFVRASSPGRAAEIQKQAHLETIQSKLKRNPDYRKGDASDRDRERRRERDRDASSHRHGSFCGEVEVRGRESCGERRGRQSPLVEEDDNRRAYRRRGRDRDKESRPQRSHHRSRSMSRSRSPLPSMGSRKLDRDRTHERDWGSSPSRRTSMSKSSTVDYSQLIEGYALMTPTERVKAKMKLQISQTAAKDTALGMRTGWERFDFNKDAPLDGDEEELEVAEDEASLRRVTGKSFRFAAAEAKHEEKVESAHDHAMFGAPTGSSLLPETQLVKENEETYNEKNINAALVSDKVLAMQQGSWRDRARKFQDISRS